MVTKESEDEIMPALSALRVHDARPERVERIRARCVAALVGGREPGRSRARGWREWLEPALALGLGALFLVDAVTRSLAVYR